MDDISDETMRVFVRGLGREETPEEAAKREEQVDKRQAEHEAWQKKVEEDARLAVPRDIEKLRKEAVEKAAEADRLEKLLKDFPNVRKRTGRWNKVAYYSKDVNARITTYDIRYNCGCCNDSPLEVWPYLETPHGNVYSDPPMFRVGHREAYFDGDRPYGGWDKEMRDAGIPEPLIAAVAVRFRHSAEEAREAVDRVYGEDSDEGPSD